MPWKVSERTLKLRAQLLLDPEDEWLREKCSFVTGGYAYWREGTNMHNVVGGRRDSALGILGVRQVGKKFYARIGGKVSHKSLGSFDTVEEAICARLRAEKERVGIQPRRAAAFKEARCGLG